MEFFLTDKYIIAQCVIFSIFISIIVVNRLDKLEGFFGRVMGIVWVSVFFYVLFIIVIRIMVYLHGY